MATIPFTLVLYWMVRTLTHWLASPNTHTVFKFHELEVSIAHFKLQTLVADNVLLHGCILRLLFAFALAGWLPQ